MAALPYMQLYVAEYLADTSHLNAAQHGAYLLLLMNYWQRGKPLPDSNDRLAIVARMSSEEWATNRAILAEFFQVKNDVWTHGRVERDLLKVKGISNAGRVAGLASAKARKEKASNDRSKTVQRESNQQNRTEQIKTEKTKLSLAKKRREVQAKPPCKTDLAKLRHKEFKAAIGLYWKSKNPDVEMPWGAPEGQALEIWLREAPTTSLEQFTVYLRNRFKSEANHTDRPSKWIRNITSYAKDSLDRFNQSQTGGNNGRKDAATQRGIDSRNNILAGAKRLGWDVGDGDGPSAGLLPQPDVARGDAGRLPSDLEAIGHHFRE